MNETTDLHPWKGCSGLINAQARADRHGIKACIATATNMVWQTLGGLQAGALRFVMTGTVWTPCGRC